MRRKITKAIALMSVFTLCLSVNPMVRANAKPIENTIEASEVPTIGIAPFSFGGWGSVANP